MKINSATFQPIEPANTNKASMPSQARTNSEGSNIQKDSVTLSGNALMLSRLYNGQDPESIEKASDMGLIAAHLTKEDRALVERMYEYSLENGIDLNHVDALASDLGTYRMSPNTIRGTDLYDLNGRKLNIEFSDNDKASAERIAQSAPSSELDKGFLQSRLTPGGRFANFNFLERMVQVFSTSATINDAPIEDYDAEKNNAIVTASDEGALRKPIGDFSYDKSLDSWSVNSPDTIQDAVSEMIVRQLNVNSELSVGFKDFLIGFARKEGIDSNDLLELLSFSHPVKNHFL